MQEGEMAEESKPQLTEEEKIERKARLFRMISRILIFIAVIVIGVFIYFAMGTKQNISQQTAIDTAEMRSKLKQIISLEKRYQAEHGEYVGFKYLQLCKELKQFDPDVGGDFKYEFDAKPVSPREWKRMHPMISMAITTAVTA